MSRIAHLNRESGSSSKFIPQPGMPSALNGDGDAPLAICLQAAGIGNGDHVVVIGHKTLDHMIALARLNCRSVTALHSGRSFPAVEAADVIWLAGNAVATLALGPLVRNTQGLRTIIIEWTGIMPRGGLSALLDDLRVDGFVQVADHGPVVIVSRPEWLRRIV